MTHLPFPDPPLADDPIRLRPWSDTDADATFRATQDPLIPRFTRVPERQTGCCGPSRSSRAAGATSSCSP
jgi:hypothetical protein